MGSIHCPLPSSLSHDASHTTGRREAPWQGPGPFPKMSREEKQDCGVGSDELVPGPALHAELYSLLEKKISFLLDGGDAHNKWIILITPLF